MRRFLLISALLLTAGAPLRAQFGNFADKPVEITADGDTRFESGTAVADNNVQIRYGDLAIYADHAEYNPDTRDVLLLGNVRIYSGENLFSGQRAFYNLETKQVRALEFDGSHGPLKFSSLSAKGFGTRQFSLRESDITTSDSSMPDWHVHARTIRLYPGDRVVMLNSTLYVGKIPSSGFLTPTEIFVVRDCSFPRVMIPIGEDTSSRPTLFHSGPGIIFWQPSGRITGHCTATRLDSTPIFSLARTTVVGANSSPTTPTTPIPRHSKLHSPLRPIAVVTGLDIRERCISPTRPTSTLTSQN